MYLSKICLDATREWVRRRHSTGYQTHRSILRAFPNPLPAGERVLFRREDVESPPAIRLLVQSQTAPDWRAFVADHGTGLLEAPAVRHYDPRIPAGTLLAFRLLANPTVKRDGRRLGLLTEIEQVRWLARKGKEGGFVLEPDSLRLTRQGFMRDASAEGQDISLLMILFEGRLQVTDEAQFARTLVEGIGAGKGLGCGMLSVARPR
jgi:CRISPR system Cascade subunit CasE